MMTDKELTDIKAASHPATELGAQTLRLVAEVERLRNRVRHLEDSLQQQTSMTDPVLGIDR